MGAYLYKMTSTQLVHTYKEYPYPHYVGKCILKYRDTPVSILLANSHCSAIVSNLNLPREVYEKILREGHSSLISLACRISHTPTWFMERALTMYPDGLSVSESISRNSLSLYVTEELLHRLVNHKEWSVRSAVANHKNTSLEDVIALEKDSDARVSISAKKAIRRRTQRVA